MGLLEHFGLIHDVDSVVVVLAPHSLVVVLDVRVVMAALSITIVNTNTMEVVRHVLEWRVLVLEQVFLVLDLALEAGDLFLDLRVVRVEHLTEQVCLDRLLLKGQGNFDIGHLLWSEVVLWHLLLPLSCQEV